MTRRCVVKTYTNVVLISRTLVDEILKSHYATDDGNNYYYHFGVTRPNEGLGVVPSVSTS